MKTKIALLLICLTIFFNCQQKKKDKEVSIEIKMDASQTGTKATVKIITDDYGRITKEIQVFEGTQEEVSEKVKTVTKKYDLEGEKPYASKVKKIRISLDPKSDSSAEGVVTFTESNGNVQVEAHINGLSPGTHVIHLQAKADYLSAEGKSVKGYRNTTLENYGNWVAGYGFHRGYIGNFQADDSGHGMITFTTDLWCLGCDDDTKNIMGNAVIVYQVQDNLISQSTVAAGARISCVAIIP
tara:strand:- start:116 stop:838 length:723 start_codon:yes stop_codon:yes gene_type:complete